MPRATCRCGHVLTLPADGPDRVTCPKCSARIRVRRASAQGVSADGFLRFSCPCGRRLKVRAEATPGVAAQQAGQCPDCGRVVPVPSPSSSGLLPKAVDHETPTEDLGPEDLAALDRWAQTHLARSAPAAARRPAAALPPTASAPSVAVEPPPVRSEAGMRVCPRCGRPVHLSSVVCRECGASVPKR